MFDHSDQYLASWHHSNHSCDWWEWMYLCCQVDSVNSSFRVMHFTRFIWNSNLMLESGFRFLVVAVFGQTSLKTTFDFQDENQALESDRLHPSSGSSFAVQWTSDFGTDQGCCSCCKFCFDLRSHCHCSNSYRYIRNWWSLNCLRCLQQVVNHLLHCRHRDHFLQTGWKSRLNRHGPDSGFLFYPHM